MDKSDIGDRMKSYEDANKTYLLSRVPVMIRLDGNCFHSFTKGFERPFDCIMTKTMQQTMKYLCENISGCVFGYTQSDEITLLLIDYKNMNQQPWFGYVKRKVESISASMATMAFNRAFAKVLSDNAATKHMTLYQYKKYYQKKGTAMFDSRAFNIPDFEVVNEFIWRQQDCIRNSVNSVGYANFSHKRLQGKNGLQIQAMLEREKGIDWHSIPTHLQRGSCCIKEPVIINKGKLNEVTRNKWIIDEHIPIFAENKDYIECRIPYFK